MYAIAHAPTDPSAHDLPVRLALVPADIREEDGTFRVRGMTTGRLLVHRSALLVGAVADLEWNRGLCDAVAVDDVLAHGGPAFAESALDSIDGDLAPDLLVQVKVGDTQAIQAVTVCTEQEKTRCLLDGSMKATWAAYRAHGLAWGVITEKHLDLHRVASAVWLCRAVERGAPFAAWNAVRSSLAAAARHETIADVLGRAALAAGVPVTIAADALGCLIASRQAEVGIDDGVIRSDRVPGSRGERADEMSKAWLREMHPALPVRTGPLLDVTPAAEVRQTPRRHERVRQERRDRRPWSRPDRYI